ncbi:MAG: HD domain-containing protein [Sulfuricella sp.]|nr:HD domain-containing protein [Sulfuricella sp.]
MRRIAMSNIRIGEPLPWNVYDEKGSLLLKKGYLVEHAHQVEALVERGLFVETSSSGFCRGTDDPSKEQEAPSVLRLINLADNRLERLLFGLNSEPDFPGTLLEVAKSVILATELNPDIAIACVLLNQQAGSYPVRHCVDTAVISILIARSMAIEPEEISMIAAAALTMNVGMLRQHAHLQGKQGALTKEEAEIIHRHPQESVRMLEEAGIHDPDWLSYVLCHHENEDGSGYPSGKKGEDIPKNARLIALADRYCACVSERKYRKSILPNVALREIFLEREKGIDPALAAHIIKEMGIYPPGTLVRLNNGEIGVVSQKGEAATTPIAHALVGPRGIPLSIPVKRDTSNEMFAIKEVLDADQANVRFSMQQVWGKKARL